MSLEVSGGGSVAVETEAMLQAHRDLERLAQLTDSVRRTVVTAAALLPVLSRARPGSLELPSQLLARARGDLTDTAAEARVLAAELDAAAASYGFVEEVVTAQQRLLARLFGPSLAAFDVALVAAIAATQHHALGESAPGLVAALRALADSISLPLLLEAVRLLPGRALEETPVSSTEVVAASSPQIVRAPTGFDDLAARIPVAQAGGPQVRVERYQLPGGEVHWIVYSAGTIDWALVPRDEPWDDTSNVVGVAGQSAGSTRAAVLALKQAGWKPGDPVVPVGHSQGGVVATAMVAGGAVSAPLLVTFGSPTGGVALPSRTIDVAIEHTDDPVPALGGSPRPFDDSRLVVRERAPAAPGSSGLPAHAMVGYRQTAAELDSSTDPRVLRARGTLTGFTGAQTAEVTLWRGERVGEASVRGAAPVSSTGGR